jgi:soluble lytic murein transglycosylase-like protein
MQIRQERFLPRLERLRCRRAFAGSLLTLAVVVGTLYAGAPAEPIGGPTNQVASAAAGEVPAAHLDDMEHRVTRLGSGWAELEEYYRSNVAPIKRVLRRYGASTDLAQRVAVALVREANRVELEPRLLLAVLLVENPWLDPEIRSPVGAVGMMQVMPLHLGHWPQCESDLEDIDANICHGARIFAHYFEGTGGDIERALLRYNGCVRGTNTPNCHQYPYHVFARAGRASVLAWVDEGVAASN